MDKSMGVNKANLVWLLAVVTGCVFLLSSSWGSDGGANFPPVNHAATRTECVACHAQAEQGSFAEREIRIPKQ